MRAKHYESQPTWHIKIAKLINACSLKEHADAVWVSIVDVFALQDAVWAITIHNRVSTKF